MSAEKTNVPPDPVPVLRFLLRTAGTRRSVGLTATVVAMSALDLFGIAIVFPYLSAVAKPNAGFTRTLATWLPQLDQTKLLVLLSVGLIAFYLIKNVCQALLMRFQFRTLASLTAELTNDMVARILSARYATFQKTAASSLAGVAYSNTVHATVAFNAVIQALNELLFLGMLLFAFLLVQPILSLSLMAVVGALGAVLYFGLLHRSAALGKTQTHVENLRHRLLFSIVSAIRDINIMGLGKLFETRNREVSDLYAGVAWRYNLYGALPRLFIELIILVGLVAFVCAYVMLNISIQSIAAILGVAMIATIRTVPAFSRLIGALNTFRFSKPVVEKLISVRNDLAAAQIARCDDGLVFADAIELRDVGFRYGDSHTLRGVNMIIQRGQAIGIVGPSGSGKTTLLDLITGLQPAASGAFLCDGRTFDPFTSQSMQRLIGYVPQAITLLDDSIAFNVSFEHRPNVARLRRALRIANLEKFVASLPERAETQVGENGLRLSGGQRQRVGIARAVYREPDILAFDEATSSLDAISERELTAEIDQLRNGITKIIVTHRLSTIVGCDRIYVLFKGTVLDSGTHPELLARCALYRQLGAEESVEEPA